MSGGLVLPLRSAAALVLVTVAGESFERMRRLTNDFILITTEEPLTIDYDYPTMKPNTMYTVDGNVLSVVPADRRPGQFPEYLVEDLRQLGLMEVKFNIELGDTLTLKKKPVLVKSRVIGDRNAVLYPINIPRHYPGDAFNTMAQYDRPFAEKRPVLVWRGATTGRRTGEQRFRLVEQYFDSDPRIDVGFSQIVQGEESFRKWLKPKMEWQEMIQYKYILSIEGNDVATGLKWQLFSNTVVFMPEPTRETWFLESRLEPYVHYIPVFGNLSNLLTQVEWADTHPIQCQAIASNSTHYAADVYFKRIKDHSERRRVLELVLGRRLPPTRTRRGRLSGEEEDEEDDEENSDKSAIPKATAVEQARK